MKKTLDPVVRWLRLMGIISLAVGIGVSVLALVLKDDKAVYYCWIVAATCSFPVAFAVIA